MSVRFTFHYREAMQFPSKKKKLKKKKAARDGSNDEEEQGKKLKCYLA